ncbi:hypothetical protein JOD45_001463 [Scopulibacillus daqui]|uniref:YgaB-like protein n=1 Tax=Scopulibacillus daqui TaxID=1469162 RepID=A0ABS2PYZ0_9BACL|nr:hypothetical protein [Scopulibacillus daqui]MBM7645252.1 hypothetical protein [Scopulibacillus daqui]
MKTERHEEQIAYGYGLSRKELDVRMDCLEVKMDMLERKISNKADEIVSMQLLHHRQELESIYRMIHQIDEQIRIIDRKLTRFTQANGIFSLTNNERHHLPVLKGIVGS